MTKRKNEIPEPYRSINLLPFDDHGWFKNEGVVEHCLSIKPAKIVIEVGSWAGKSTRFIADRIPEDGKVYAVDTWLGSPELEKEERLPNIFHLFCSNVVHAGLTHKIIPIRMQSLEAAKALNVTADFIYIDAAHDEDNVFQDVLAWSQHLAPDGIICGDDWNWDSVKRGVLQASLEVDCRVMHLSNCWWFVPNKNGSQ